ncbi:hypothetical protein R9C00_16035 [Flammeovirgaceae bacterium SG7u.111]|nr:hypothetical protein [Flammeovirgaceae bacterium SG7u.132]WPO33212.1 hypothetical protein R9C00_16035 [Flammeovirgaceae bacterium SG7u.111]
MKIVGINLLILIGYSAILRPAENFYVNLLPLGAAICIHSLANLIGGIQSDNGGTETELVENKKRRQAFFLSTALVLLIGFSTCLSVGYL